MPHCNTTILLLKFDGTLVLWYGRGGHFRLLCGCCDMSDDNVAKLDRCCCWCDDLWLVGFVFIILTTGREDVLDTMFW